MNKQFVVALEIALVFLLILAQIWFVGKVVSLFTILPLGVIILSWVFHKESLRAIGLGKFEFKGFGPLWMVLAIGITFIALIGIYVNRSRPEQENFLLGLPLRFASYLLPALGQQVILNGYFVNRIKLLTVRRNVIALVAGVLFCMIHAPNPVLLGLTLFGGTISAYFFVRKRNLYPLTIAHAAVAAVAYCMLPQLWHHGFRVGMQYYLFVPTPGDCCTPEFLRVFIP